MEIKKVLLDLSAKNAQGQLVVKLAGEEHLCKILFENARAVHISMGRLEVADAIEMIKTKMIEWIKFIDNYPVKKTLDIPLHDELVAGQSTSDGPASPVQATISAVQVPASSAQAPTSNVSSSVVPAAASQVSGEQIERLKEDFLTYTGQEGTIHFIMAAAAVGYQQEQNLSREKFIKLVESLAQDLPEEKRQAFLRKHSA